MTYTIDRHEFPSSPSPSVKGRVEVNLIMKLFRRCAVIFAENILLFLYRTLAGKVEEIFVLRSEYA